MPACADNRPTTPLEEAAVAAADTWTFEPETDRYSTEALLDLRELNETVAGQSGFVGLSADGDDLVKGDGSPIRFWAVNSMVWARTPEALADHARFLAKRGVNVVRWHGSVHPKGEDSQLDRLDEEARDKLWQLVAAMKEEGIYTTISPYYANTVKPRSNWGVPRDSDNMQGLLFFDPQVQEAYKSWLRDLFETVNPYTGIALKDEPAVAIVQLQNEDSLLFWTVDKIEGRDLELLGDRFGAWLESKYGSLAEASRAWEGETLEGDDFDRNIVAFYPIYEMTQTVSEDGSRGKRLADQTEFWIETMREFNGEMVRFLREEVGVRQLINAGNWKTADPMRLNDGERYSYTPTEIIGVNRYYNGGFHEGEKRGWAIVNGDKFGNRSVLLHPDKLPLNIKQVSGHPTIVPESSWVPPLGYQSEGPFLTSVFQSLAGVDGFYWFAVHEPQWRQPASANGFLPSIGKWVVNTPELLGNFPAASLMYRRGYIAEAEAVVREKRSLEDLWNRRLPSIAETRSFDPNRDRPPGEDGNNPLAAVHPLAFLVGPVEVEYDADPAKSSAIDFQEYIDEDSQVVRSVTGEVVWDYGKGICTVDAPKAQGATGFLDRQASIDLADVTIVSGNDYATAMVVSMDDKPIAESEKILVQAGTVARPTGWQQREVTWEDNNGRDREGFEVVDYGTAPWQLVRNDLTFNLNNPGITRAIVLDANGLATGEVELIREGDRVRFSMPDDAKYLILTNQ
ncbi:MAG: hypothetical protein SWY16_21840 [Cyanobacteriota bacterium]|nr:hypothetical protein [Cyanobacteriota bacterium]